jgi:hypothetical protein
MENEPTAGTEMTQIGCADWQRGYRNAITPSGKDIMRV